MPFSLRAAVKDIQDISYLTARAFIGAFRRPYYIRDIVSQMDSIGVGSIFGRLKWRFFFIERRTLTEFVLAWKRAK